MTRVSTLAVAALLVWTAASTHAGGWAVTTVDRLPDYAVAGQAVRIEFTVRQHGHTLASGLRGAVVAKLGGASVAAEAHPAGRPGAYYVDLTLPRPGMWGVNIGLWGNTKIALPVVASASDAPRLAPVDQGRRLFEAKGCATCHRHEAVAPAATMDYGPALTGRRYPVELLTVKLLQPAPCVSAPVSTPCMPLLGIRQDEIGPLAAFLNTPTATSAAKVKAVAAR